MLASSAKSLLKRSIDHTSVHNRQLEERSAWRSRDKLKHTKQRNSSRSRLDEESRRRYSSQSRTKRKRHCHDFEDDQMPSTSTSVAGGDVECSTLCNTSQREGDNMTEGSATSDRFYWTQKLYTIKSQNPTEWWGHDGYRELYPEEFDNKVQSSVTSVHHGSYRELSPAASEPDVILLESPQEEITQKRKKKKKKHRSRSEKREKVKKKVRQKR